MKMFFILIFLSLQTQYLTAQTLRETRAVWLSTNYKLDWPPPTYNEGIQKKALIKIFDDIEKKNLNTSKRSGILWIKM